MKVIDIQKIIDYIQKELNTYKNKEYDDIIVESKKIFEKTFFRFYNNVIIFFIF